ncbi:YciI family protein [Streptomyces sp. NPDC006610]|jgi:hypothetical protein|uniref:YciI family protein n=1 Tax=Streptomyces sp. NPDC006610 TaxID=3154584 RepID=UPI0033B67FD8
MPRFLMLIELDENSIAPGVPSPEVHRRMGELLEEMTRAGVLLDTAGLQPSAQGTRVRTEGGRITVVDGPFTETKEVVGGYAFLQCKDKAEAVEWSRRFLAAHGEELTFQLEVREVEEG